MRNSGPAATHSIGGSDADGPAVSAASLARRVMAANQRRHARQRRRFEQREQRDMRAELPLDLERQPHREQRVAAERKETVVAADVADAQQARASSPRAALRDPRVEVAARSIAGRGRRGRGCPAGNGCASSCATLRQRPAIDLAAGVSGSDTRTLSRAGTI